MTRASGSLTVALGAAVTALMICGPALAQCAMCATSAQATGAAGGRVLARAILFLLIPTIGLLGGAGVLLRRFRG